MKSVWRRALERAGFAYWLLWCSSVFNQLLDFGPFDKTIYRVWIEIGLFTGRILGVTDVATDVTGSGDRTIDWLILLSVAILALVIGGIWSAFDPTGRHDTRVRELVRVVIRYTVGLIIISYGVAKLSYDHGQFPRPSIGRLTRTYGESSPMGILWTFMGASYAYTLVSGLAEILGGVLVLFRRTSLAGALVLFGVMLNVTLLNFCYDVPVKINSAHYLAMAIAIALPDLRRLFDVVVRRRAVAAPPPLEPRTFRGRRWPMVTAKVALLVIYVVVDYRDLLTREEPPTHWYDDLWEVDTFTRNGQAVPPILNDKTRWRRMRLQSDAEKSFMRWHLMDGSFSDLLVLTELTDHSVSFKTAAEDKPVTTYTFALTRPDADHFTLAGKVGTDELAVTLHRLTAGDTLLMNRGFHWISEVPFNR